MNNKMKTIGIIFSMSLLVLSSCGDSETEKSDINTNEVNNEDNNNIQDKPKVDHRLPAPSMFFDVISRIGGEAREDLTNSIENVDKYTTADRKALNFGVYFADVAYLTSYETNTKTLSYLQGLKKMADDLSISAIFSDDLMQKMSSNNENLDSMSTYADEVYYYATSYLENEEKGDILSLMLIGGWIESMHIVTNLVDEYDQDNEIISEIASQKVYLESILEHAIVYAEESETIANWIDKLYELMEIFNESTEAHSTSAERDDSGKIILSSGDKVKLDELAFGTIVEKIKNMRSEIVNAE